MKIYLGTQGDSAVGVEGESVTIDWPDLETWIDDDAGREKLRTALIEAFSTFYGERFDASFGDQCEECGQVENAHRPDCPNRQTD